MIIYFYSKFIPAEISARRFSKSNQDSMDSLLQTYGLADVRETIDKAKELIGQPYKPQVYSIPTLLAKYEQVKKNFTNKQQTIHL